MANYTSTHTGAVIDAAVTKITATSSSATELNLLDGVTATTAEINILDGVTSTAAELNILDGVTSTASELNILDGVTATAAEINLLDGVTATTTELNLIDGVTATTAEINYIDGVTSNIQTQLNLKAPIAGATFTGTTTFATLSDGTIAVTAFVDEDNMASDSATLIPTQQSVKAYVDTTAQTTEEVQDIVGAMFSSNTESGITVDYQDGDGTIDLTVGTLNQNTTGTAATVTTAAQPNITSLGTLTTLTVDNVIVNGTTIGHTSDTDLITLADGNVTIAGELDLTTLDVSGNADIDGTLETDALTIGGVTSVPFESADHSKLDGIEASADVTDTANVTSSGALMDSELASIADIKALDQSVISGATPTFTTTNFTDASNKRLMTDAQETKLDSVESNATADQTDEEIQDVVGAMFSSNTETGITATYQDADGTIDLVVGTLNQDTTGTASKTTVTDSTANTDFPVVFHDESNALLDDTGALRYNPSTGELLVPKLTVAGTTTTVDTVTMEAANAIKFEGATADANETILSIVDPTNDDNTQYLLNASGYIPLLAAATTTAITSTPAELNVLDGYTGSVTELNYLDTLHATGVTNTEFDYLDGVTSNIQTQLNAKIEATLTSEQVQDIVGAMFTSNTETRIAATYEDGDGTIDLVVDDMTANDNTTYTGGTNLTLSGTTFNVDDAFLINSGNDTTSGTITAGGFTTTGNLSLAGHAVNDIDIGSEFVDADDHLMTSGAIKEKIESYSYLTTAPVTALNNATANELVTVGSTTTELDAEANLTFDGSTLALTGDLNVGSGDFFIDDSEGRVGIGTASPGEKLTIKAAGDTSQELIKIRNNSNTEILSFGIDGSGDGYLNFNSSPGVINTNSGDLYLSPSSNVNLNSNALTGVNGLYGASNTLTMYNNTYNFKNASSGDMMTLNSTGLGIGTTSPEGKLHIYQSDASVAPDSDGDDLVIESDGDTGISILSGEGNGETGALIFGSDNDAFGAGLQHHYYGNALRLMTANTGHSLEFATDNNTTAMTINASRNVILEEELFLKDNKDLVLGNGSDIKIYHNSSSGNANIENYTGSLYVTNYTDDGDIFFRVDDGGGNVINAIWINADSEGDIYFPNDYQRLIMGAGNDLQFVHNGTNNYMEGYTGDLYIDNYADDKDIIFRSDDGSGGVTAYLTLDGSAESIEISKKMQFPASHSADKIVMYSGGNEKIGTEANTLLFTADNYKFKDTAGHDNLFMNNSGAVGIGTTSPDERLSVVSGSSSRTAHFGRYEDNGLFLHSEAAADDSHYNWIIQTQENIDGGLEIHPSASVGGYDWVSAGGIAIKRTGEVGIGTNSPDSYNSAGTNLVVVDSGNSGISIVAGTTSDSSIMFADGTGGTAGYRGRVAYDHNGDYLRFDTAATERVRIDSAGLVGIGTTSPGAKLDIENSTAPTLDNDTHAGEAIFLRSGGSGGDGNVQAVLAFGKADSSSRRSGSAIASVQTDSDVDKVGIGFYTSDSSASSQTMDLRMLVNHTGNLHVDADVVAYSTSVSDERLKDNIETIPNALDKVMQLRGVEFDWNKGNRKGQKDLGLIAQEVEKVLPEIVREKKMAFIDNEIYKTIDYDKIVGVLVEAIKEQQKQINKLEEKLNG